VELVINPEAARTLLPTAPVFTKYALSAQKKTADGSANDGAAVALEDITATSASLDLAVGKYVLTVTGHVNSAVAARGESALFTVTSGANTPVAVTLDPVTDAGAGTLKYTIDVASGLTASLDIEGQPAINLTAGSTNTDDVSLAAGQYLVELTVSKSGSQTRKWAEIAHVYSNLETAFTRSITANYLTFDPITGTPAITGSAVVGQTLGVNEAGLTNKSGTPSYVWKRDGTAIADATAATYELVIADLNHAITVTVSYSENSGSVTSAAVQVLADTTAPSLSAGGVSALSTSAGTTATLTFTTDEAGTYYAVPLASTNTAPTVTQVANQTAGTSTVRKTGAATAGENTISLTGLTRNSTYTAYVVVKDSAGNISALLTITGVNPVTPISGSVSISGTIKENRTLKASISWSGLSYQWQMGDSADGEFTNISSATAQTYKLAAGQVGKYVRVVITETGYTGNLTATTSSAVLAATAPAEAPTTWTTVTLSGAQAATGINTIAYANGRFVFGGGGGKIGYSAGDTPETFGASANWTVSTTAFTTSYSIKRIVANGNNLYAVAGSKAGYSTANPPSFTENSPTTANFGNQGNSLQAVVYGAQFVAAGSVSADTNFGRETSDGKAWSTSSVGTRMAEGAAIGLLTTALAYGNSRYVAVGYDETGSKISYSSGPTSAWTTVTSPFGSSTIRDVTYGGSTFVAVGDDAKAAYSTDTGATWTLVDLSGIFNNENANYKIITGVAYGNGIFVAVGYGKIAYSRDGIAWTEVNGQFENGTYLRGITYGNNRWIIGLGGSNIGSETGSKLFYTTNED
jgi:hypothetical protein